MNHAHQFVTHSVHWSFVAVHMTIRTWRVQVTPERQSRFGSQWRPKRGLTMKNSFLLIFSFLVTLTRCIWKGCIFKRKVGLVTDLIQTEKFVKNNDNRLSFGLIEANVECKQDLEITILDIYSGEYSPMWIFCRCVLTAEYGKKKHHKLKKNKEFLQGRFILWKK